MWSFLRHPNYYKKNYIYFSLYIKLSQMIGSVKHFESNRTIYLKIINTKLFKKHRKIWEKISGLLVKHLIASYDDSDK